MTDLFNTKTPLEALIEQTLELVHKMDGVLHCELMGSAMYLENPNDIDIGVLVELFGDFMQARLEEGWESCGDYSMSGSDWGSIRKGKINLIVMADPARMERFHAALQVCKYLELKDKKDRVAVCQIVRDKLEAWQVIIPADLGS